MKEILRLIKSWVALFLVFTGVIGGTLGIVLGLVVLGAYIFNIGGGYAISGYLFVIVVAFLTTIIWYSEELSND